MKKLILMTLLASSTALSAPLSERDAIRSMKGCYEVQFHFIETFVNRADYAVRSPEYKEHGLEWVDLDVDTNNEIALQHLLITPQGVQKHWRQEWSYEPTSLLNFKGLGTWSTTLLNRKMTRGMWAQRVYQVDDSPRYECAAPWVQWTTADGVRKNYWECEAMAPLPRREFSQRSDYQVLDRRNRHEITEQGWLHEQDNGKMQFATATDLTSPMTEIAREKGLDTYTRVEDSRCAAAKDWWMKNKSTWHEIQAMWKHVRDHHPNFSLKAKVNDKTLWMRLFEFADQASAAEASGTAMSGEAIQKQAHDIIHEFMVVNP